MKRIVTNTMIMLAGFSSSAYAAGGPGGGGASFLTCLFLGFLALIIWCQVLPALKHFIDMLKGLSSEETKAAEKRLS